MRNQKRENSQNLLVLGSIEQIIGAIETAHGDHVIEQVDERLRDFNLFVQLICFTLQLREVLVILLHRLSKTTDRTFSSDKHATHAHTHAHTLSRVFVYTA